MRKIIIFSLLSLTVICAAPNPAKAQDPTSSPTAYMNAISTAEREMNQAYMTYISASAHSSRKRKIEKLRGLAVDNIVICRATINNLPQYKGDNSLRQGSLDYVQLCYKVFNEDYAHIVNMEDIAERSYDEMQAYLLLQEATNDSLEVGGKRMERAEKNFASKYGVTLVDEASELGDKMKAADVMSKYYDKVYLIFFKCNWEDNQLTEAVNQKNVTKIEQTRSALDKYCIEGLAKLDTLHTFDNDGSLRESCRDALNFYKNEAEKETPKITDFYLKQENFNKLKATLDAKPANQRTQKDVDTYNQAVNDINSAVSVYNQSNNDTNSGRSQANNNWQATEKQFLDTHTPYYEK